MGAVIASAPSVPGRIPAAVADSGAGPVLETAVLCRAGRIYRQFCDVILLVLLVAGWGASCLAQDAPGGLVAGSIGYLAGNPRVRVDRRRLDWPDPVAAGTPLNYRFLVFNDGHELLSLEPRSSCGCTTVRGVEEVLPGSSAVIPVEWDTRGMAAGKHEKAITLLTNDEAEPSVVLEMGVEIVQRIRTDSADPQPHIALVPDGRTIARFSLVTDPANPVSPRGVSCSHPFVHPGLLEAADSPGRWELVLEIGGEAPEGATTIVVFIQTDGVINAPESLPFVLEKGILVEPDRVVLRPGGTPQSPLPPSLVRLRASSGTFRITGIESDDFLTETRQITVREGVEYGILFHGTPRGGRTGLVRGTVRILTDYPGQPVIELEAVCYQRELAESGDD